MMEAVSLNILQGEVGSLTGPASFYPMDRVFPKFDSYLNMRKSGL